MFEIIVALPTISLSLKHVYLIDLLLTRLAGYARCLSDRFVSSAQVAGVMECPLAHTRTIVHPIEVVVGLAPADSLRRSCARNVLIANNALVLLLSFHNAAVLVRSGARNFFIVVGKYFVIAEI